MLGRWAPKSAAELQLERLDRLCASVLELQTGISVSADFLVRHKQTTIDLEHPAAFLWDLQEASEPVLDTVRSFFIEVWAFRELALRDGTLKAKDPDGWLSNHPVLLLAFDVGNSLKHPDKKKPPRSGGVVDLHLSICALSAVEGNGLRRAQFTFSVVHNGIKHNGYSVATSAVSEWKAFAS